LKKQSRLARTQDVRDLPEDGLASAGIEGPIYTVEADKETIDTGFQFRLEGSGPCAIRALRVFMDLEHEPDNGQSDKPETDDHFVRFDGAAADNEEDLRVEPETFTATKTAQARRNNFVAEAEATVISTVSQSDADKRATQVARARAEARLRQIVPVYEGGGLT
jgi:hypothetical protein